MKNASSFFVKHKEIFLIIFLIFILGFCIRAHLLRYEYMFEYDPYWHLRATGYVLQGNLPDRDPLGFYGQGGTPYAGTPKFLWYFTAAIYKITTLGAGYDKWLLMNYARVLPAIFGALIAVAMFFLGKEIYNKKTGIVMGLVAATIPAFVYRTMAGFFEEDSLGFLWLVIGFIFFVKALKNAHSQKHHIVYGIVSALFFGLMAMTWNMFLLIPLVMMAYFFTNLVYMWIKKSTKHEVLSFVKVFLIIAVIFFGIATWYDGTDWIKDTFEYVDHYLPVTQTNLDRVNKVNEDPTDVLGATVGEENTGKQFFLSKYNFSIWVPFAVLPIMFFYLLLSKKKDYVTLILFYWLAITLFMAWGKLKFTYTLGLPIAAGAGFLFYVCDELIMEKSLAFKRIFAVFFGFFVLASLAAGVYFITTNVPPIDEQLNWKESLFWMHDNTPENAKIFNWWDYGHWITYFTERKASTDNFNYGVDGDANFGQFIITDDLNRSKEILKKYDADYIMTDQDYFSRYTAFAVYGYTTINYSDPRVARYAGVVFTCAKQKALVTNNINYVCGGNTISQTDMNKFPTTWTNKPNELINGVPMFVYKSEKNDVIYIINSAINNSVYAKIYFKDPSTPKIYDYVYTNNEVKVFKVNKDLLK